METGQIDYGHVRDRRQTTDKWNSMDLQMKTIKKKILFHFFVWQFRVLDLQLTGVMFIVV